MKIQSNKEVRERSTPQKKLRKTINKIAKKKRKGHQEKEKRKNKEGGNERKENYKMVNERINIHQSEK